MPTIASAAAAHTAAMEIEEQQRWAARYRQFADQECPQQPLYVAICQALAADPELLALHEGMPAAQARPNLLLAALHEAVLEQPAQPLAAYFRSVGGRRSPDAELPGLLRERLLGDARLRSRLLTHATQTNEAGRCAPLRLAIDALVERGGWSRLALFDFGCSAGLNLAVDADELRCAGTRRGPGQRLRLDCEWRGGPLPSPQRWTITARLGVDPAPVDVRDAQAARWLQACVWPDDVERVERLRLALAWARRHPPPVERQADGLQRLTSWLDALPGDTMPLLLNSWVLAYFSAAERTEFHARVLVWVRAGRLAWICAEDAACHPAALGVTPRTCATLWSLHWGTHSEAWAWSHAHGGWAEAL